MGTRSGRSSLLALWLFLTTAGCGLALIVATLVAPTLDLVPLGAAVLGSGALCFLVVQFWTTGTRATAAPVPTAARPVDFAYSTARPSRARGAPSPVRHHAAPAGSEEDLVEFELVGTEPAPTSLHVPAAFQVEAQADAEPPRPRPWIEQTISAASTEPLRDYTPAVERRQEIVSGLPLLSSIFSEPTIAAETSTPSRNGKTRGQCGSCGTFLWAPTQRPIRLRCPKCGHVKTLTE
jgi:hypothetical protein